MPLEVPPELHRNAKGIDKIGYEYTGETAIKYALDKLNIGSLKEVDLLDMGCGVRFTQTIVNRDIPIKTYTGLELDKKMVDFLNENVSSKDSRFEFYFWNAHNTHYNPNGIHMRNLRCLPFNKSFDLIWAWSVFTHLTPSDSLILLQLLRKHIRGYGKLFFSAFIDEELNYFDDRLKGKPLHKAYYGKTFMEVLLETAGWKIDSFFNPNPKAFIQHHFICSPI